MVGKRGASHDDDDDEETMKNWKSWINSQLLCLICSLWGGWWGCQSQSPSCCWGWPEHQEFGENKKLSFHDKRSNRILCGLNLFTMENIKYRFSLLGNINAFSGAPKVWNWDKCEWFYPKSTPSNLNLLDLLWISLSHLQEK